MQYNVQFLWHLILNYFFLINGNFAERNLSFHSVSKNILECFIVFEMKAQLVNKHCCENSSANFWKPFSCCYVRRYFCSNLFSFLTKVIWQDYRPISQRPLHVQGFDGHPG
jgi:hypothetical protein